MPVVAVVVRRFGALHVAAAALVLASIPKLLLGIPLPAAGVAAVLVLQGFFGPLTGAPIFTVITTRTPAALRTKVLSAAVGLMFLTGPLGQIAAGPLINAVGARMVFVIAAAGNLVGSAPFAIYVARNGAWAIPSRSRPTPNSLRRRAACSQGDGLELSSARACSRLTRNPCRGAVSSARLCDFSPRLRRERFEKDLEPVV